MQTKKVDVIIVGGGVIGVSIAYYAAVRGASVLLIERGAVGSGASHGNAGLLVPSHCQPLPSPGVIARGLRYLLQPDGPFYVHLQADMELARWLWRFCRSCNEKHLYHSVGIFSKLSTESMELHRQLAELGGDRYEYAQSGLLTLYINEKAFVESQEYYTGMKTYGIETAVLNGDQVRDMEPEIGPQVIGGLLHKMDGRLDPAAFVSWLAGEAREKGVRILSDTEVFWLENSRRRVTSVVTTHGDFQAEQIVLAGGAWIPQLTSQLGVRIPIRAAKGYSLTFHRPGNSPKLPLLLDEARMAITPFAQTLRMAGTLELAGGRDLDIDRSRLQAIRAQAHRYLPNLGEIGLKEIWRGLRPCTPDGLPIFGRLHPYSNVLIAGGHGTKGMLLGPVSGKYISQMLAGGSIGMMERSLKPRRF